VFGVDVTGDAMSPAAAAAAAAGVPAAAAGLYVSDSSNVDVHKYHQLYVPGTSSSAVGLVPSVAAAAGTTPAVVPAAMKPPACIITPNIHQPPPALPPFPPAIQVSGTMSYLY